MNNLDISPSQLLNGLEINKLIYCKELTDLNADHKPGDNVTGQFKITSFYKSAKLWYNCASSSGIPEIIAHYLHLNLSFVEPNHDFDGTIGWANQTHAIGPLEMFLNNQVDYITNDVIMNERISHPNSIGFPNYLVTNFGMNFLLQKQSIRLSIGNYLNVFNPSIWLLFLLSILAIASVEGLKVKNLRFTFDLIFNYLNLLLSTESSNF